jgi:excisionase family DNA binding protein
VTAFPTRTNATQLDQGKRGTERSPSVTLPSLIGIEAVAECLGVSVRHIRRLIAERRIPFVKVGHFVRFDPQAVLGWVDEHRVEVFVPRTVRRNRPS